VTIRRRASLRWKVALVILLTTAVALVLAGAAFFAYEYTSVRSRLVPRLAAIAGIVAENCKAALIFQDRQDAERTLAGLRADPRILAAAVYSENGQEFARFSRGTIDLPLASPAEGSVLSAHHLALASAILADDRRLGTLYLIADLSAFEDQFREFARVGGSVLLIALLVAGLLAYRLQRVVADPILQLVTATRTVADRQDFAVRVAVTSDDELGLLASSWNGMLGQIERRDAALRDSEARYALAVRGAQDGLWDWNLETHEIYYAPRWAEMLGYEERELAPRLGEWLGRIHPEHSAEVAAALDAHLAGTTPHFQAEYRMRHRNGSWLWVFSRGLAVRDSSGRALRIAGSQSDVTERKGRDALTGLPNRLLFVDRLEGAWQRAKRRQEDPFAVLAVDLERLDLINETLGRNAGRELLVAAADRIQAVLGEHGTLARLDGGVFAILLDSIGDANGATRIATTLHAALAPAFRIGGQDIFTSAAIGIALSDTGYEHPEDALRDAESALGRARDRGWNQSEVYDQDIRVRAFARLELEDALRVAVVRGELELYYQPIVALAGRGLAGCEALSRWQRGAGAPTLPGQFIGLAEETGLIVPLGSWVLHAACRQLREWRANPLPSDFSLSINVSALQLARLEWIEDVEAALRTSGVPPRCLKLEITESALVEQLEPLATVLRELHGFGVGLWLDDFGTGFSNLSYLHRFPLEVMKIDRSFVSQLDGDGDRREIVSTIIALARSLGMRTVAEGVETSHQLERLAELGCDFVQGNAVSPPLAAPAATALLQQRLVL
jgi:diguanylate cyclase (GGDEF)-like protein/PAS domain S-box-containing protein